MFARLPTAFIFGSIFILILDFLLFVGLKLNYFDYYGINLYFNRLFTDNQPYLLLLVLSFIVGYLMLYLKNEKLFHRFYILLLLLCASTFYPSIGQAVGEILFIQKDQKVHFYDTNATADILYASRDAFYIKKRGFRHAIKIDKKEFTHYP
ncbi:MAG: isoleucyl-tRNA synthetase [Epsilonproteobacteria bacterium]|nr:isoleucyl-tRNA synthetase [Campylobacterota bacterium]